MRITLQLVATSLALVFLTTGCVSQPVFQRKSDEADHYAALSRNLEQDYAKLIEQQKQMAIRYDEIAQQMEDARNTSATLRQDNLRAKADIERLEKILADRSNEAGIAMTDLRQAIDRLEEEKRQLTAQLEQEQPGTPGTYRPVKNNL